MKFVYVLVSNESDNYLEQLYLSLISFNMRMKHIKPIVLTDERTFKTIKGSRGKIKDYADIIPIRIPENLSNKQIARFLKTSLNVYLPEDFLFIDCDTIICDELESIEEYATNIYCVPDSHVMIKHYKNKKKIQRNDKILGFQASFINPYHLNSGVILYHENEINKNFYNEWHKLWKFSNEKKISSDQTAFNEANNRTGMKLALLPGVWNCQIAENGLKYISEAKIIHYFSSTLHFYRSPYLLADSKYYKNLLNSELSEEIIKLLKNPKSAFHEEIRLLADPCQIKTIDSKITKLLYRFNSFF